MGNPNMYGESEKIGPEMICRPPRFQLMRFTLTTTLNIEIQKYIKSEFAVFPRNRDLEKVPVTDKGINGRPVLLDQKKYFGSI